MAAVVVHGSAEALAESVAAVLAEAAAAAVARHGRFRLALPGGRTPVPLYRMLAAGRAGRLPWEAVEVLFADERAVPPDDPASNFRLVRETLLEPAGVPPERVRRMAAERADLDAAAREYAQWLAEPLDALVLALGEDGHVASLFPGSPLLDERTRRVAAVLDSPKPPPRRLTVLPRVAAEARRVLVLATGAAKATAVRDALEPPADAPPPLPFLSRGQWHLDRAAAGLLRRAG